jgi:pantetheine-phosphate adenylyltransferase
VRLAVYAGAFDPITLGHLCVIQRGARLFDRLWILVAVNPAKRPLFSAQERVEMISEVTADLSNASAASTAGYVVDFARTHGAAYLIRGVRGSTDVEAEVSLATLNHQLAPDIETVFVPAHPELSSVSSSRLKELAAQGADLSKYCPPSVARRLHERLSRQPTSKQGTDHV